jgi:hypothetical protein
MRNRLELIDLARDFRRDGLRLAATPAPARGGFRDLNGGFRASQVGGVMRILRQILRVGLCLTFAFLLPAAALAADTPDLRGRWRRNPELSQDAVSKVFASLSLEGQGLSPDDRRFHDALLHFAKVIDRLEIEQTPEDVKIILAGDEVEIYYPGRSHVRQGVLGGRLEALAHWRKDELIIEEKNEFGKLIQSLSLNREGRLSVLVSLDDRRLREPLLLLSVYDRSAPQP